MTCTFTKPTVVPTASAWIGTSFWRTVVTRTSGGGGAGGSALLQALPKAIASMASVAATTRDALEPSMTNSIPDLSEPQHFKGRDPGGERRPRRERVHRLAGCIAPDELLRIEDDPDWIGGRTRRCASTDRSPRARACYRPAARRGCHRDTCST